MTPPPSRYYTIVGAADSSLILGPCVTEQEIIETAKEYGGPPDLAAALVALNIDGRSFEIFNTETQMLLFVDRAKLMGLGDEAMFLTRQSACI